MDEADILGVKINAFHLEGLLVRIRQAIQGGERLLIMHANVHAINLAVESDNFRKALEKADLVYCDGAGIQLGARWLAQPVPERFTLADWVWDLAAMAAGGRYSIYLLGNPPGVAGEAAFQLKQSWENLELAGFQHGFFEKSHGHSENERVIGQINVVEPDILLVGLGMPEQEFWLVENWPRLQAKVAITCGALFEYLAGSLRRGPSWLTRNSMEWLARMAISPKRYAWRYVRDIPVFMFRIIRKRIGMQPKP